MHDRGLRTVAIVALGMALANACARAEAPRFEDGDRVCFIGDSITHQAHYHTQIVLFYSTRFPQMRLETWNCGFAGDTAAGAVKRYAWDIAPHRPTVATIMLGMNDVSRSLYAEGKSGADVEAQRKQAIARNTANMQRLVELLTRDGTRVILITPSLFDQTGRQQAPRLAGVNDALKACATADRELAARYHASLVDFNGPMEAINRKGQERDPNFTIVGADRVHPGPVGHLVMAYLFLKAQRQSPLVAHVAIDAAKRAVVQQDNCRVTSLSVASDAISFTYLAEALPFPVDATNEAALGLVPFTEDLNQELLRISGLSPGPYELAIDGRSILKTTAAALASGINLAVIPETPQYQQAKEVQRMLAERAQIEGRKLRTFAQVNYLFLCDLAERSEQSDRRVLEESLAKLRKVDSTWNRYRCGVLEAYQELLPQKEELQRRSAELLARIGATRLPKSLTFKLQAQGPIILGAGRRGPRRDDDDRRGFVAGVGRR